MVSRDIAAGDSIEQRSGTPRPLKRWRLVVVGRAMTALVRESSSPELTSMTPERSRGSERRAAPAA